MLDIDHLTKPLIPARTLRAFTVGVLLAAGVFLLAAAGCGNVAAIPGADGGAGSAGGERGTMETAGAGGAGSSTGAAGARSDGGGLGGASGATGEATGGVGGARDAGTDAMCIPEAGVRYCAPGAGTCPSGLPEGLPPIICPAGTVKAGSGGSCPAGKVLVALYDICVPGDAGAGS